MIHLQNISKTYPNAKTALQPMSLRFARGEMAFVTGHSGAGKSTLLNLIIGAEPATRGHIFINGEDMRKQNQNGILMMRRNMGIVKQNPMLLKDRTVYENVSLPLIINGFRHHEIRKRTEAALDKVGLLHTQNNFPAQLSAGEQQRVSIARAVVNRPQILLADEPTGNLDPQLSQEILRIFTEFNAVGTTVVVVTHDLTLIPQTPHRIIALHQGQLIGKFHEQTIA
jgi:cell division transport system ATP-binding protein